ncbi:MAG: LLM class flavin-dependent oxidoreductase [Rhodospirillaceae bacterium]|nr:LLM class flavin-dependent oxidoreductase [Rhodospirillaceae bacterium]
MPIQVLGLFSHRNSAEHRPKPMSDFELPFLSDLVKAYDRNGYDRMLIANAATWPDSIPFAAYIAGITERVGFMIAHRPGFVQPTMAARMLATIDNLSRGRAAVHIITGANNKEMEADGDFLTKAVRYDRSAEYVDVMRRVWTSDAPFDHEGQFFKFNRAFSALKPVQKGGLPVFWGGSSPESVQHAGRCADVYAMGIETLDKTRALIESVRAAGQQHNRTLEYCLSARLIIADTEEAAWQKARDILDGVMNNLEQLNQHAIDPRTHERFGDLAKREDCLDTRLWMGITKATKGTRAVTSLVGTPEQVVNELMRYYDLGVTHFLISGFDFVSDPDVLGRDVIPRLRAAAADRERIAARIAV